MNPPQVYMCSPPWTLLPPPSPYHPYHLNIWKRLSHPVFPRPSLSIPLMPAAPVGSSGPEMVGFLDPLSRACHSPVNTPRLVSEGQDSELPSTVWAEQSPHRGHSHVTSWRSSWPFHLRLSGTASEVSGLRHYRASFPLSSGAIDPVIPAAARSLFPTTVHILLRLLTCRRACKFLSF